MDLAQSLPRRVAGAWLVDGGVAGCGADCTVDYCEVDSVAMHVKSDVVVAAAAAAAALVVVIVVVVGLVHLVLNCRFQQLELEDVTSAVSSHPSLFPLHLLSFLLKTTVRDTNSFS